VGGNEIYGVARACGDLRGNKIVELALPGPEEALSVIISIHPTIWARRLHELRYPEV
jgi:hypothetical protein